MHIWFRNKYCEEKMPLILCPYGFVQGRVGTLVMPLCSYDQGLLDRLGFEVEVELESWLGSRFGFELELVLGSFSFISASRA